MSSPSESPPSPRSKVDVVAHVLAVWFGCGHVPIAPGTAGTIGALPLWWVLRRFGGAWGVLAGAVVITIVGIWAADVVAKRKGMKDPQIVVIDEVAGVLFALAAAPRGWIPVTTAVVLFRVFDQIKPFPARTLERKAPGGWGIVLDDVAAGGWAALLVGAARALGWF